MSHRPKIINSKFMCTVLTLFLAGWACVTAPETGRKQLIIIPEGEMLSMGDQAFQEIKQKTKSLDKHERIVEKVTEITSRLMNVSGADFKWEVEVFDSEAVNAFCLPGGKIGVYTGILKVANTNAAIAAVLGHEIAHAVARHGAERMSQMLMAQGVLTLADLSLGNNKYHGLMMTALGAGFQLGVMLPYSRKHEQEADQIGTHYMALAGYDPNASVKLWEDMSKLSSAKPPELLSTHPSDNSRIQFLKSNMNDFLADREKSQKKIPTETLPDLAKL